MTHDPKLFTKHDPALVEAVARGIVRSLWGEDDKEELTAWLPEAAAALDAIEAQGWVVVPREPTVRMRHAAFLADDEARVLGPEEARDVDLYRAMIAARPGAQP